VSSLARDRPSVHCRFISICGVQYIALEGRTMNTEVQWHRNEFESGGGAPYGSKNTISRFGERFHDGQYSLVSFLFAVLLLTVPTVPRHL